MTFNTRGVGSNLLKSHFSHFLHVLYSVRWHTASFGSGTKTVSAAPFWHLPVPGALRAGACKRCGGWFGLNFSARARATVEGWTPSGHTRLLSASRLRVTPGHCMHSKQSGQQSASLLAFGLGRCRSTGCAYGCHLLRAVRIGRMGSCVHSTLWKQARIGMQPDVASGRCVQLRLCPTRLPRGHRKITRSNTKATSDLHS